MAQITSVTSEALQSQIRALLPSQQGFGEDLQASNVIVPIIDLTAAAEGSSIPTYLQTASDSSVTTVTTASTSAATVISGTGFWQIGIRTTSNCRGSGPAPTLRINDGTTTNDIWVAPKAAGSGTFYVQLTDQIYVFLRAGDTVQALTSGSAEAITTSVRQVASITGVLSNPTGFTIE